MNKCKYVVATWYDTVTAESAAEGDYAATGQDWREYGTDSIREAARLLADKLSSLGHYELNERAGEPDYAASVAYGEAHQDPYSGDSDSPCAALISRTLTKREQAVFNKLVRHELTK